MEGDIHQKFRPPVYIQLKRCGIFYSIPRLSIPMSLKIFNTAPRLRKDFQERPVFFFTSIQPTKKEQNKWLAVFR